METPDIDDTTLPTATTNQCLLALYVLLEETNERIFWLNKLVLIAGPPLYLLAALFYGDGLVVVLALPAYCLALWLTHHAVCRLVHHSTVACTISTHPRLFALAMFWLLLLRVAHLSPTLTAEQEARLSDEVSEQVWEGEPTDIVKKAVQKHCERLLIIYSRL
jgi:hypothetical protein